LPRPDIVILLDIDVDKLSARKVITDLALTEKLRHARDSLKRFEKYHYWRIIDANQKKDKINKDIVSQIESLLNDYNRGGEDFENNFYPYSVGEDLFMYNNI
jgi:thymidylate kinase